MPFKQGDQPWNAGQRVTITCDYCGRTSDQVASRVKHASRHFCNRACKDAAQEIALQGSGNPRYMKRAGENRTCKTCGKSFYVYPSYVNRAGRRNDFCSNACKGEAISAALKGRERAPEHSAAIAASKRGKPQPWHAKPDVQVSCLNCGQPFTIPGRATSRLGKARFCSTDCWYTYVRLHPEEGGNWKGGYEPYYGPNWKHQAKLARERDNHTCQTCGLHQFNPRLDVHHIRPKREFAGDYAAANHIDNLTTLCKSCHSSLDRAHR